MLNKEENIYVGVVSAGRPQNVPLMSAMIGNATWYVNKGEAEAYKAYGAEFVIESGNLVEKRNHVLEDAFKLGAYCCQISDDLKSLKYAIDKKNIVPIDLWSTLRLMKRVLEKENLYLAGAPPTANAFYFNPKKPLATKHFVIADLILVRPTDIRFDGKISLKEDHDFTIQHVKKYGGVARLEAILAKFQHYSNKGGCVSYRTPEEEQKNVAYLKKKWGDIIRDNPRRSNEILLKF